MGNSPLGPAFGDNATWVTHAGANDNSMGAGEVPPARVSSKCPFQREAEWCNCVHFVTTNVASNPPFVLSLSKDHGATGIL